MEETGEAYFDVDFDLNDDEYMEEVMGRFRAANAGQGSIIWIFYEFMVSEFCSPSKDRAIRIRDIEWMKDQEFVFTYKNYFDEIIQGKAARTAPVRIRTVISLDNHVSRGQ